eukprot:gene20412-biopygen4084
MGLGPHPVARARRGLRNCKAAPLGFPPQGARGCPPVGPDRSGGRVGVRGTAKRRPPAWRRRPATPHMSGVGAPAIRPRNCRAGT